jgi:hypothetical protein
MESCEVNWLDDGTDNGYPMRLSGNIDYDSVFVGGYSMGDIQWHAHTSLYCLSGLYWKNTKNMADGCSAHVKGGFFHHSNVLVPDNGAFIFELTTFNDRTSIESAHHGMFSSVSHQL